MPLTTRQAMLDGIRSSRIIVGAYVDREGGVCPMLAAHRNGGRTSLASFARCWDRYTKANGKPRSATERELRTLTAMLEASVALDEQGPEPLTEAIAEHKASMERRPRRRVRSRDNGDRVRPRDNGDRVTPGRNGDRVRPRRNGDRDRTDELKSRPGWAWMRPFRRLDEYEIAMLELEELQHTKPALERERELV